MIPKVRAKLLLRIATTRGRIKELQNRIKQDTRSLQKAEAHMIRLRTFQKCGS